jgi:hypothetical protein
VSGNSVEFGVEQQEPWKVYSLLGKNKKEEAAAPFIF